MRYKDQSVGELFQRIIHLANEHADDEELYNNQGETDWTLRQIQLIVNELNDRVDEHDKLSQ